MLTADLAQSWQRGGRTGPRLIDPEDPDYLRDASSLIALFAEHEGRPRSALRHALARADHFGQIVVLYGARTPEDFCYSDEVESWRAAGVELRQVISKPDGYEWAGSTGYVQSLLDNVLPNLSDPVALICGSRDMIEQTRDRLHEMGFAPEDILTNY